MNKYLNMLIESSNQVEALTEQSSTGKNLYIEGIFAQSEKVNGNGRLYEKYIMETSISKYDIDYVSKKRAAGELNHPANRIFVDLNESAIRTLELKWDGNDVYGKALVLNTPKGQIIKGLLEGGFNLGVSTRALGSLKEKNGIKYVQNDLMFTAIDVVDNPSGPDCYVDALTESTKWMINESTGTWVPVIIEGESDHINEQLFLEKFENLIKGIKK